MKPKYKGKLYIEVKKMNKEKIKEMKLTKRAKYGFASMFAVAALSITLASVATRGNVGEEQYVNVTPNNPQVDNDTPVVVVEDEKFIKPFLVDAAIKTYYFDINDNSENQNNALIYYNGMYTPSTGIDYAYNNNAFNVVSVFSGVVIEKKVDPLYGATVYIRSNDNPSLVAVYASLSDVSVNVGDTVKQEQLIAKAGNNTINSSMANHLNFSILKNNKNINPLECYSKKVKDI